MSEEYIEDTITNKGISLTDSDVQLAIVAEGKHQHLYAKNKSTNGKYINMMCLGRVPKGMFCNWQIGSTNFVQRKFRSIQSGIQYALKRLQK